MSWNVNWKLLLRPSLVVCVFSNLIWALPIGALTLFGGGLNVPKAFEGVATALLIALLLGLFLCGLVIPSLMVAAKVEEQRFLHGLMVGCVGWTLGLLGMIPTGLFLGILWELKRLLFRADALNEQLGQGIGILCGVIWFVGLLLSPGMGILAVVAGGVRDRRGARSGVPGTT